MPKPDDPNQDAGQEDDGRDGVGPFHNMLLVRAGRSHRASFVGSAVRTFYSVACHAGAWSAQRIYQKGS